MMTTRIQYFEQAIQSTKEQPIRSLPHKVEMHITLMRLETELKREMGLEARDRPKVLLHLGIRHDSMVTDK